MPKTRTPESYRRPLPEDEDVTLRISHPLACCPKGHTLINRHTVIRYVHDIPAVATPQITQHTMEKGYCPTCKKEVTAYPVAPAPVTFGPNIQRFVAAASTVFRLSQPQIQGMLKIHYNTTVASGEIAKMIERESVVLHPERERILSAIQLSDVKQLDETSWKVCIGDGSEKYCWIMTDALGPKRIYVPGVNRGKGNCDALLGENPRGCTVSDDYGAYHSLPLHQLCFAHVHRDFKDLAQSAHLSAEVKQHCRELTSELRNICRAIDLDRNPQKYEHFASRLRALTTPFPNEPAKLSTYKATLTKNIPKYLTCLTDARIPLTNNRAERDIRHVVLKRNVSFGSRTPESAKRTGILLSVLMTRKAEGTLGDYLRGV